VRVVVSVMNANTAEGYINGRRGDEFILGQDLGDGYAFVYKKEDTDVSGWFPVNNLSPPL
jgi:hypothetical protein